MKSKKKLKKKLHDLIDSMEDEAVLNMVNEDIVAYTTTKNKDLQDDLTPEQLKQLEQAIDEADRGETMSLKEFKKQMDEWRTKLKSTRGSQ